MWKRREDENVRKAVEEFKKCKNKDMMLRDDNGRRIIWGTCDKESVVIKDCKEDIIYRQVRDKEEKDGRGVSKGEQEKRIEY